MENKEVAFGEWLFSIARPACIYKKKKKLWQLKEGDSAITSIENWNDRFKTTAELFEIYKAEGK